MDETIMNIIKVLNLCEEEEKEMINRLERGFSICLEFDYDGKIYYTYC